MTQVIKTTRKLQYKPDAQANGLSKLKSGIGILPVSEFGQQKHRLEAYATIEATLKVSVDETLAVAINAKS